MHGIGGGPVDLSNAAPSLNKDEAERQWAARYLRNSATPQDAISLWRWNTEIDVRDILSAIHVPTLILHRSGDRWVKLAEARYLADRIEGARFVELPSDDHVIWAGNSDRALDEIEDFLTGVQRAPSSERVLATILVAEISDPISRAATLGHEREKAMRQRHYDAVSAELRRYGGALIKMTEDGLLAKFDGPTKAIQCAVERRRAKLEAEMPEEAEPVAIALPPRLDQLYARKLQELEGLVDDPEFSSAALEAVRGLISRIDLAPREGGGVTATVYGDLAEMVALAAGDGHKKKDPRRGALGGQLSVVAGHATSIIFRSSAPPSRRPLLCRKCLKPFRKTTFSDCEVGVRIVPEGDVPRHTNRLDLRSWLAFAPGSARMMEATGRRV